jgi:hypothetical protein
MPIHGYPGGVISATPPTVDNTTASGIWTTEKQLQYQAQGLWPMPGPAQPISRSLRFNSADSTYLTRTPGSAGNRKTWTWSGWLKKGTNGASMVLTECWSAANNTDLLNISYLTYAGNVDSFSVNAYSLFWKVSTPQYRDPSAWYHVMVALDTTLATADDRIKLYVNGQRITAFNTSNNPSQNADLGLNQAYQHSIGARTTGGVADVFNGYLTEINFIDGQALSPSSFGQTNSITGVWEPKPYTGTYGTNGYYLNFSDNSNTTAATLGKDYSGNGNNWTPNNFSVTAGAGNDSLVDTPTSYGTDTGVGGTVRGNYCTFSSIDKATTVTISNGNLDLIGTNAGGRARATMAVSSGKWYFEFLMVDTNNGGSHGFMSTTARADLTGNGSTTDLGVNADTWGVFANGTVKNNNSNGTSVSAISNGQIGMFALDMDSGKFWYGVNGTWSNSGNPATGANPVYSNLSGYTIAPGIGHGVTTVISYSYNFGQRPFAYTAPSGFKALCTQNLPTPTVAQGDDYFNPVLYTGNGSTQSITGVNFAPDFVWIKSRSAAYNNRLYDRVRGVENVLQSNTTAAEASDGAGLTAFGSDGFTLGSSAAQNENASTFVAWNWKANGAGSTNTAGSITSTVSANTTAGFSIVTFTTPSSNGNYTTGHGLGVAPSMIITKSRSSTTQWPVWHIGLTGGASNKDYNIYLNLTNAQSSATDSWGSAAPNSTTFGVNVGTQWLGSINIVAYCFAAIPGFSAFGSYVGNGSSDGPFVYCGFRPAFLLTKRASTAGAWHIYDSARSTYNINDIYLIPDTSAAENSGNNGIDFLSNGFKLRSTNTGTNENGTTIIYAAFASNPFKYALAR